MKHNISQRAIEIMNTNLPSNNGEFISMKVNQVLMHMTCFDEERNNVIVSNFMLIILMTKQSKKIKWDEKCNKTFPSQLK
jgi:hypothetical protein